MISLRKRSVLKSKKNINVTVVIPLFNEEKALQRLFSKLNLLKIQGVLLDFIFVDDGSTDKTHELLCNSQLKYRKTVISLSRNFGHQSALLAGLEKADGQFIVTMDGDLQHPPSLINTFINLHQEGYEIVFTKRNDPPTFGIKYFTSKLFYILINSFSEIIIPESSSDFRSMNRQALNALLLLPESNKFLRGMSSWIGFKTVTIAYDVDKRAGGESKYTFSKMLALALTAITSFTTAPLALANYASGFFLITALLYALYVVYARLVLGIAVSGWASVLFVLLIASAFICFYLSLLGMYISSIFREVKKRPQYIVHSTYEDSKH